VYTDTQGKAILLCFDVGCTKDAPKTQQLTKYQFTDCRKSAFSSKHDTPVWGCSHIIFGGNSYRFANPLPIIFFMCCKQHKTA